MCARQTGALSLQIAFPGQPWKRHYCFHFAAKASEARRGEVICPRSRSGDCTAGSLSDSKDSVCFSSTINTLWETRLLAGKWSCPARGWFNGWHWPLEVSAEMPSLLLDVTAALCVLGSCGLQRPSVHELEKAGSLQKAGAQFGSS